MPVDAIVRISFESVPAANQAANDALVGLKQGKTGPKPFSRVATATYSCSDADDTAVANAIEELGITIAQYGSDLDFVSISVVRRKTT